MHHTVAIVSSLTSLGLACALYVCNVLTRPGSWLRSDMLAATFLSLLTGLFPLAIAATAVGLWQALTGGISLVAMLSAGADLVAVGAILTTAFVFRAIVNARHREVATLKGATPPSLPPANKSSAPAQKWAA